MQEFQTFLSNLFHVSRALQTAFDNHLKDTGITAARGRVLLMLAKATGEVSQAEVTKYLRVEHPTAVRILDGLEAQGMVKRLPSETDRRAKLIVLTEEGRPLAEEIVRATEIFANCLSVGLDPEEVATGTAFLAKVHANIAVLLERAEEEAAS